MTKQELLIMIVVIADMLIGFAGLLGDYGYYGVAIGLLAIANMHLIIKAYGDYRQG